MSPTFLFHWKILLLQAALSSFFLNRDCLLHQIYNLPLDIIPTSLLKGFLDIVCPSVISTVNSSTATGAVSPCFMHAMILPLVKMIQFSAVSDPFPLYCSFCTQNCCMCLSCSVWMVTTYMEICLVFRSWLIWGNVFLTLGSDYAVLFLVDFKAAFNMVNNAVIIDCLEHRAGVNSTVLA